MTTDVTRTKSNNALWDCVRRALSDEHSAISRIRAIERRRSELSSSYECEIVTVQLTDGQQCEFFLKSYDIPNRPKHQAQALRERELRVYRDLLTHVDLGTAAYRGSAWDEEVNRYWLLLEYVEGQELRHCDIDHWIRAAGWLGRMQRYFYQHTEMLRRCDYLERHDAEFFMLNAERAARALSPYPPSHRDRLSHILQGYEKLAASMASQPRVFVHGHYRPQNIIVGIGGPARRLCPVDWEKAALGSPFYDLAHLVDGFEEPVLEKLLQAYRDGAGPCGVSPADGHDLHYLLNCFWLHRTLTVLGKAVEEQFPETGVVKLLHRAEAFRNFLRNVGHR
jgi:thiamine kinase-like enzyme